MKSLLQQEININPFILSKMVCYIQSWLSSCGLMCSHSNTRSGIRMNIEYCLLLRRPRHKKNPHDMSERGISLLIGQHFVQQEAKGLLSFMSHLFLVSGYLGICDFGEKKTNKIPYQPIASRSGCVLQAQQAWSLMVSEAPPPPA